MLILYFTYTLSYLSKRKIDQPFLLQLKRTLISLNISLLTTTKNLIPSHCSQNIPFVDPSFIDLHTIFYQQ